MKLNSSAPSIASRKIFSNGNNINFSAYVLPIAFIIFVAIIYAEDFSCVLRQGSGTSLAQQQLREKDPVLPFSVGQTPEDCNIVDGEWVYDEESRPLYFEDDCPYIPPQQTCLKCGRQDHRYQHWRWEPHGCALPRFNASFMLEKIRGKRVLFVGDSLNRGQFMSLVCMLHGAIPGQNAKPLTVNGSLTIFNAEEYDVTVEFYWAPFLVESNSDDAIVHRVYDRIIRAGTVRKHAAYWKGADIVIFNTYMWWMSGIKMKILRGPFPGSIKNIKRMEAEDAYRIALRSVVRWVEKNMDPRRTRVFFASLSPTHEKAMEWGGEVEGNCLNETEPIKDPSYWGFGSSKSIMAVVDEVLRGSKFPIKMLNITQLSDYRKDGHVSIYKKHWNPLTAEQLANPRSYADCVHWCLPGVPDVWNEILYAKLFFP